MNIRETFKIAAGQVHMMIMVGAIFVLQASVSRAGLNGSYAVDGLTLHLWHFDETGGSLAFDAVSNNAETIPFTLTNVSGPNYYAPASFALNDQPSYAVSTNGVPYINFTNCLQGAVGAGYFSPFYFSNNVGQTPCIPVSYPAYTNLAHFKSPVTGAFTIEAMIQPNYNPTLTTAGQNGIVMGDNQGANGPGIGAGTYPTYTRTRGWWFDISGGQLNFFNIGASTAGTNNYLANIPVTGPDAGLAGQWYHVAVSYTGFAPTNGDTPKVYTLYWTLVDPARTSADALMTWTNTGATNGIMGTPFLAVGCSARVNVTNGTVGWAGFNGKIDEVRISSACRKPTEMIFNSTVIQESPVISGLPTSSGVSVGGTLTVVSTETGSTPITNQWYQVIGGVTNLLAGQTNKDLVIPGVGLNVSGTYFLAATNAYGSTISSLVAVSINSASFDGLFNTGVDNNGKSLAGTAPGSYDPHWLLVQNPDPNGSGSNCVVWNTNTVVAINPGYIGDTATAAWIGPEQNTGTALGVYDYETTFFIDQGSANNGVLSGTLDTAGTTFGANGGSIVFVLNGVATNIPNGNYNGPNTINFTITNGFLAGSNVLDIILTNTVALIQGIIVENLAGSSAASAAPPTVYVQPQPLTVNYGNTANFSVVGLGAPQLTYQWRTNNTAITTAATTNRLLSFTATNVVASAIKNGVFTNYYSVIVANSLGSVTSSVVQLTINCTPVITSQIPAVSSAPITLFTGSSPSFSVAATGPSVYYQWFTNGVAASGATNLAFTWTNIPVGSSSNYCVVTNVAGSVTSLVWSVSGVAVPTAPYPQAVLASSPVGYWRLNEPDDNNQDYNIGQICHDYVGGNNGIYTNIGLGYSGYTADNVTNSDPDETSVLCGVAGFQNDSDAYGIPIDFSTPTNSGANFTIEAWVKGNTQLSDSGVVGKGYAGGEQFSLDCASDTTNAANPYPHSYRFIVRDAGGGAHAVNSSVNPNSSSSTWHHLVGVCNETNGGYVAFYIDGTLVGTNAIAPGGGILSSTRAMVIGAKPSTATTTGNNLQFSGYLDDVAAYPRALSAAEVASHYYAVGIAVTVVTQPVAVTTNAGATAVFSVGVSGTPAVTYQWYSQNNGLIADATNATLVLANVQANDSFYVQVANSYASGVQSSSAALTLVTSPIILVDVPANVFVLPGQTTSIPVMVYGAAPLAYQWQFNGVNLSDNARITGSQSSQVLTIANAQGTDAGGYQVVVTNSFGAVTSSVSTLIVGKLPLGFNNNGAGWTANSFAGSSSIPVITNGLLTLTDGGTSEARSFFFNYPQYIGAFTATFTYSGKGVANGSTFCIQNDSRGASALGGTGGRLGVASNLGAGVAAISPSWELEFDLYTGNGVGYAMETNAAVGPPFLPTGNAGDLGYAAETNMLDSGDPIGVTLNYANGMFSMILTDAVAGVSFSTNANIGNLPAIVGGSTAYVGFTACTGGSGSTITITNFSFVSVFPEAIRLNGGNVLISWPGNLLGYSLQQNSDLTTGNWVTVTNVPVVTNNQNQIVLPAGDGNVFYRLILQ